MISGRVLAQPYLKLPGIDPVTMRAQSSCILFSHSLLYTCTLWCCAFGGGGWDPFFFIFLRLHHCSVECKLSVFIDSADFTLHSRVAGEDLTVKRNDILSDDLIPPITPHNTNISYDVGRAVV